ncbi:MAG: helix-turn-helix transcriptional regulator [Actinobacteria bacterium]|nr:helix-turn-helix transcriptional regulator [Actinomycetota bacterium]
MPTVTDAFAEILLAARRQAGLSQEELGLRSGLDRTTISALERGVASPKLESLIRIAGALDKDPAELLPSVRWRPPAGAPTPSGEFVDN